MGYVFDALNRADDDNQPKPNGQVPVDPTPAAPTPDGDSADPAPTPVDQASAQAIPPVDNQRSEASSPTEPPEVTDSSPEVTGPKTLDNDPLHWADEGATPYSFNQACGIPTAPASAHRAGQTPRPTAPPSDQAQAPTLRITSEWASHLDDRLVALTEPSSSLAEEYRAIRTSMLARWEHRRNLVHTITSAMPQEGKTITSLNLGLCLAELRNRKIIVVEADLRLPTFNKLLHLDESKGMVEYLRGEAELHEVIQELEGNALHIITAGSRASNDTVQLLSNQRMINLLQVLRTNYDHVIIDTPPVIELADAGIIGGLSDEVMLIARISRTPRPLIEQALRALRSYNAPVAGVIVTDQERAKNRYRYYRYGYRNRYRYYAKRAA